MKGKCEIITFAEHLKIEVKFRKANGPIRFSMYKVVA